MNDRVIFDNGVAKASAVSNENPFPVVVKSGGTTGGDIELGFVQLSSFAAAAGLGTIPDGARWAFIEVEGQPVRWRADGTNPTITVGHVLNPGDVLPYGGTDLAEWKAIETSAGAKLNVSFYG